MKKTELSAEGLASLDLAIKKKLQGDGITGDNVCNYIGNVIDAVITIGGIFAMQPLGEKMKGAVTSVLKDASAEELMALRENLKGEKS